MKGYFTSGVLSVQSKIVSAVKSNSKAYIQSLYSVKGSVSSILKAELKEQVKEALPDIKELCDADPEFKEVVGVDVANAISSIDTNNIDTNSDIFKALESYCGDLITGRVYSAIGEPRIYNNFYGLDEEGNSLTTDLNNTDQLDYLAMQGRFIYNGEEPLANIMSEDQYNEFLNSSECADAKSKIAFYLSQSNVNHENVTRAYAQLGYAYIKIAVCGTDGVYDSPKNAIQDESIEFESLLNYARLYREASLDVYYNERNATTVDTQNSDRTYRGTPLLRNLINGNYKDSYDWSEFLTQ